MRSRSDPATAAARLSDRPFVPERDITQQEWTDIEVEVDRAGKADHPHAFLTGLAPCLQVISLHWRRKLIPLHTHRFRGGSFLSYMKASSSQTLIRLMH